MWKDGTPTTGGSGRKEHPKMRTKPVLLLIVAVTGWSSVPPASESRESALGEEIITVIAAALDSPAPALTTIGIIDGTWNRIADEGIAAGIGQYAEESGTAVECSWDGDAGRHACSGNPSLFLVFEPYEGDATSDEIRFMVSTLDFGTAFRLSAKVVPIETGGSTIQPPRFTGFLHFAYEPPGDTGEELPERDNCRGTLTDSGAGLQRAADTGGMFWLNDTDDIYPSAGVVYSTTYGDRDTGRAKVWVNRREQPPGGLPHSVTHATLHATLNDTYFTESTRLEDMIRVESAARSAAAGCYHLVREPGR